MVSLCFIEPWGRGGGGGVLNLPKMLKNFKLFNQYQKGVAQLSQSCVFETYLFGQGTKFGNIFH